jgi:general secretion pathway protein M
MIEQIHAYWAERSEREQRLLGIMTALLAAVILWFAIIAPLKSARLDAQARLDQAILVSGQISARADALRRATRATVPPLGSSLGVAVGSSATQAGFTPTRMDPQGDDRLMIAIASAKSPALFAWLDGLEQRGIFAEKIAVRPNSDATVSCEATLRLRRP